MQLILLESIENSLENRSTKGGVFFLFFGSKGCRAKNLRSCQGFTYNANFSQTAQRRQGNYDAAWLESLLMGFHGVVGPDAEP